MTKITKLIQMSKYKIIQVIDTLKVGGKKKAVYENGLYFDETIAKLENEKL